MEDEGAEPGTEEGDRRVEPDEQGNEDGRAEHREDVLEGQGNRPPDRRRLLDVIDLCEMSHRCLRVCVGLPGLAGPARVSVPVNGTAVEPSLLLLRPKISAHSRRRASTIAAVAFTVASLFFAAPYEKTNTLTGLPGRSSASIVRAVSFIPIRGSPSTSTRPEARSPFSNSTMPNMRNFLSK